MLLRWLGSAVFLLWGCSFLPAAVFSPDRLISDPPPRRVRVAGNSTLPGFADGKLFLEIVVPEQAVPAVRYAAAELGRCLRQSLGVEIPLNRIPSAELTSLVLGDNSWSRAAGLTLSDMPLDGFFLKSQGNSIYLAGIDDPEADPGSLRQGDLYFAHGTLTAVYEFLERFLGVRFYFPGETGTIIPRITSLSFPEMDILERPDLPQRHFVLPAGFQFPELSLDFLSLAGYHFQLRNSAFRVPEKDGLASLRPVQRWAAAHPEILRVDENGRRTLPGEPPETAGFCFASEFLCGNLYADAAAFLSGSPASVRGLEQWAPQAFQPGFFNLSLPDDNRSCCCSHCRIFYQSRPESERFWGLLAGLARKLQENGIPGYVTFCSDGQYAHLPQTPLPGNILIAVSAVDPWFQNLVRPARLEEQLLFWKKSLKRKAWLAVGLSNGRRKQTFLPATTPESIGNYFSRSGSMLSGAFFHPQSAYGPHQYLNLYIASKCTWNTSLKAAELLQEHHRLMFGPGAAAMGRFFHIIETLWLGLLKAESALPGQRPGLLKEEQELWRSIYTPGQIEALRKCLDEAATAAEQSPAHLKRIQYMQNYFLEPG